jgi:hypothetical protein
MNRLIRLLFFFVFICLSCSVIAQYPDSIRLNDIRILASHNSYKRKPDERVIRFLQKFKRQLGDELDPRRMDYGHVALSEQFNRYDIRGIELDIYNDPHGGRFNKRRINCFIRGLNQRSHDSLMRKPGFKVLHIADVDYESNYNSLIDALQEISTWSKKNPAHIPVFINLELKDAAPGNYSRFLRLLGFKRAIPFDSLAYLKIDEDIQRCLGSEVLFTPAMLRDTFASTRERLTSVGWPSLNSVLGKVMVIFDGNGDDYKKYIHQNLAFVYGNTNDAETAFVIRNNPLGNEDQISALSETYIVRTRTDVETMQARTNDYSMFDAAIKSRAQILSTDYYAPDAKLSGYYVSLNLFKINTSWPFILR